MWPPSGAGRVRVTMRSGVPIKGIVCMMTLTSSRRRNLSWRIRVGTLSTAHQSAPGQARSQCVCQVSAPISAVAGLLVAHHVDDRAVKQAAAGQRL